MAEGPLFAVTTRSRLRGPWFFPAMVVASLRIRRQLAASGDVVRWASIVAGPTEFWTITVWRSRHDMQQFMHDGAHDEIMWLFSRWLRSFWLMRWRAGEVEYGTWDGLALSAHAPKYHDPPVDPQRAAALARALEHLPLLRDATGPDGAARYDATPSVRRRRAEVGDAAGVVVRVRAPAWRSVAAWRALRRLAREARGNAEMLRLTVGVGRPGDLYLLTVWAARDAARAHLASPTLAGLVHRWPESWAAEWVPENEFGHWDGLRLRRSRDRYAIAVPREALRAADPALARIPRASRSTTRD